jgi:TIR domain-containing protein
MHKDEGVDLFVSYRREDTGYLALAIRDRLLAIEASTSVFVDASSIPLGETFTTVIRRELRGAHIVLVLVGPGWRTDRLFDEADYVRFELVLARELGKRIVPVLLRGQVMPDVTELPDELAWFPHLNAFFLSAPTELDADVQRLYERITNRVPEMEELRSRIWTLYETGRTQELLESVGQAWREHSANPSPALADCCRIAAVAMTRATREDGERDLWLARAMSTAYQAGASNTFAVSLLPFFFRLVEKREFEAARGVMNEIARLSRVDHTSQLPRNTMSRLYHEKVAFSYASEGNYERALSHYDAAVEAAAVGQDQRAELKIRGGKANCEFLRGSHDVAVAATRDVAHRSRELGYDDIADIADRNLDVMTGGQGALGPYDVT